MAYATLDEARLYTLKDGTNILPGVNQLDDEKAKHLYESDWLFKHLIESKKLEVEDDSGELMFRSRMSAKQRHEAETNGHVAVPTMEVRKPEHKPEPEPAPSMEPAKPRPLGGGVPGLKDEALKLVSETEDLQQLMKWAEADTRKSVKAALAERMDEVKAAAKAE